MRRSFLLLSSVSLLAAAAAGAQSLEEGLDRAHATMIGTDGSEVGAATVTEAPAGGVLITIEVTGLPAERWLGFHIHEGGECDPAEAFETAGEHFDPDGREHGYFPDGGPHAGDMPNQFVAADGTMRAQVFNGFVTIGEGAPNGVRGRTLMVHDQPDDYESQPSGDAGDRLACGVIQ